MKREKEKSSGLTETLRDNQDTDRCFSRNERRIR